MACIVPFRRFQPRSTIHSIEQKGESSWWVERHPLGADGSPLPYGRIVHFCRSLAEAEAWASREEGTDLRNGSKRLAMTS